MSYCTVQDVESLFPRFVPNQAGSIQDNQIQSWLNDASGQLHAAFMQRGMDIDQLGTILAPLGNLTFVVLDTQDQSAVLKDLCRSYGVYKLGMAIFATLGPAEQAITRGSYNLWTASFKLISQGFYDMQFAPGYARTVDISPGFQGVAGAETENCPNPWQSPDGGNRSFWKNIVF